MAYNNPAGDTPPARALSLAEAGHRLGDVSRSTLNRMIRAGELRSIKIGARRLIPESEIVRIVEHSAGALAE